MAAPGALTRLFNHAEFAPAGSAEEAEENGERLLRGIFRKVHAERPLSQSDRVCRFRSATVRGTMPDSSN